MKYVLLISDGMADYPVEELDGLTPLEAADTPHMDTLAARGRVGLVRNVPSGMSPGSDVAVMSVLGFDPAKYYTGRAPLEAPAMGVELEPGQIAVRSGFNLPVGEHEFNSKEDFGYRAVDQVATDTAYIFRHAKSGPIRIVIHRQVTQGQVTAPITAAHVTSTAITWLRP